MEKENESSNDPLYRLVDAVKEIASGEKFPDIVDSFQSGQTERFKLKVDNAKSSRSFLKFRGWIEIISLIAILATVLILAWKIPKLDGSTIGTLLGSIIGYVLGRSKNSGT